MEVIKDVEPICLSPVEIKNRNELLEVVELPCQEACFDLYDKNIKTVMSSANFSDQMAYIDVDYNTLDEYNQKVANSLIELGYATMWGDAENKRLHIIIPINQDSKVEEVSKSLLNLTSYFGMQDLMFGKYKNLMECHYIYTGEKCNSVQEVLASSGADSIEEYMVEFDLVYDYDTGEVYFSQELLDKHKSFIKSQSK